jgi:HrpA-like RNA helicase
MGYGVREETDETCVWFVTTGYLVQYLSHANNFDITHLIIDEVHERSLDGDLCCYLTRELLRRHPNLRLILMSATVDARMYEDYFNGRQSLPSQVKTLFVGVRRFPVEIIYLEDLISRTEDGCGNNNSLNALVTGLINSCLLLVPQEEKSPSLSFTSNQYQLSVQLIRTMANLGTAILVFVAGIADIDYFVTYFEGMDRYRIICIHSEIPLEEQEKVFDVCAPNEIKVILATNAAESSLTLPDVDIVICLGSERVAAYNKKIDRVELDLRMISQTSATQRAGRTGRVQPGQVFRLYTRELYESFQKHRKSEVLRIPLHDTILKSHGLLGGSIHLTGIIPVLANLPEAPALTNVLSSFEYLFQRGLITEASDEGSLTCVGQILSHFPVDIALGRFLLYGIMLGITEEVVIIAAALQLSKSPFRIPSPFSVKDPLEFLSRRRNVFLSMSHFDEGSYSEPIMLLNVYRACSANDSISRRKWCQKNCLDDVIMRLWQTNAKYLGTRVADACNLRPREGSRPSKLQVWNLIRACLVWSGEENILKMVPIKKKSKEYVNEMCLKECDQILLSKVVELIPPKAEYYVLLDGLVTFTARFSISDLLEWVELPQFLDTYATFSQLQSFKVTVLTTRREDNVDPVPSAYIFFLRRDKEEMRSNFPMFDFDQGVPFMFRNGWMALKFLLLKRWVFESFIDSVNPNFPLMQVSFHDHTTIITNRSSGVVMIENLFADWKIPLNSPIEEAPLDLPKPITKIVFRNSNPPATLFQDVPLEIRLFNFLLQGRKDRSNSFSSSFSNHF